MTGFVHDPHPRHEERRREPVPERVSLNGRVALWITDKTGSMWAAYVFSAIAAVGAYAILAGLSELNLIVVLVSQTFLQLVLLPIIIVGQNLQGRAADKRADATWKDAEAILHELLEIQRHLAAQDAATTERDR